MGADVNNPRTDAGQPALAHAECAVDVALLLLHRGADPSIICRHTIEGQNELEGPALWQLLSRKLTDDDVQRLTAALNTRNQWPSLLAAKDSAGRGLLGWMLQASEPNVITAMVQAGKLDPVAELG